MRTTKNEQNTAQNEMPRVPAENSTNSTEVLTNPSPIMELNLYERSYPLIVENSLTYLQTSTSTETQLPTADFILSLIYDNRKSSLCSFIANRETQIIWFNSLNSRHKKSDNLERFKNLKMIPIKEYSAKATKRVKQYFRIIREESVNKPVIAIFDLQFFNGTDIGEIKSKLSQTMSIASKYNISLLVFENEPQQEANEHYSRNHLRYEVSKKAGSIIQLTVASRGLVLLELIKSRFCQIPDIVYGFKFNPYTKKIKTLLKIDITRTNLGGENEL